MACNIQQKRSIKYLGIFIDENLKWDAQIQHVNNRIAKKFRYPKQASLFCVCLVPLGNFTIILFIPIFLKVWQAGDQPAKLDFKLYGKNIFPYFLLPREKMLPLTINCSNYIILIIAELRRPEGPPSGAP